jgi:hypothetical protein
VEPPPPQLSDADVRHFHERGFVVVRGCFGADETARLRAASDGVLSDARGGAPPPRTARQSSIPFFEHSEALIPLLTDDRIYGLACDLLGPNPTLNASEGNLHVGDTQWHGSADEPDDGQDSSEPEGYLGHVKIAFYLQAHLAGAGALRIAPGTHRRGARRAAMNDAALVYKTSGDSSKAASWPAEAGIEVVVPELGPTDVVCFTENCWHSSFGGAAARRQHAVSFMADCTTAREQRWFRHCIGTYNFSMHPHPHLLRLAAAGDRRVASIIGRLVQFGSRPTAEGFSQVIEVEADGSERCASCTLALGSSLGMQMCIRC